MFSMTNEQRKMYDALTNLEKMVVIEHLTGVTHPTVWRRVRPESTLNDAAASVRVNKILRKPKVREFVAAIRMDKLSDVIMSREEAEQKLTTLARGNMADLVEFATVQVGVNPANNEPVYQAVWVFKDSALMDPEKLKTIAELACSKEGFKIKQHSPLAAIKQLAEMKGWNAPTKAKVDHTSSDGTMTPKDTVIDASKLSTATLKDLLKVKNDSQN